MLMWSGLILAYMAASYGALVLFAQLRIKRRGRLADLAPLLLFLPFSPGIWIYIQLGNAIQHRRQR